MERSVAMWHDSVNKNTLAYVEEAQVGGVAECAGRGRARGAANTPPVAQCRAGA